MDASWSLGMMQRRVNNMNASINFNEVRKLAAQAAKSRAILGCIRIENGTAMWTDANYMVAMGGYGKTQDITISLLDYSIKTDDYPRLEKIINYEYGERSYKEEIMDGKVVYVYERLNDDFETVKTFIDQEMLDQIKKLINNKKFNLSIPEIELNESRTTARITVDPLTKIYFMMKLIKGK